MARILILYSTTDGHTLTICQRLQHTIEQHDHQVTLVSVSDTDQLRLTQFDKIVIGASIRYGKHQPQVYEFINKNIELLYSKPNAFFTVNVVARKPDKSQPETNPYIRKFLQQVPWQPKHLAVFAGKINYPKYSFWDRQIIRLIMWLTKGPTNSNVIVDYTNWQQVEEFAELVCRM